MTETKKKPGRPPLEDKMDTPAKDTLDKIGNFVTINTANVKGTRINLEKINSYAPNGEISLQLAWGDKSNTTLTFGSAELMQAALAKLDEACLR